jgi:hypothetical protein
LPYNDPCHHFARPRVRHYAGYMGETVVFRPRSAGAALAVVAFPLLSAVCVLLGVLAVLALSPIVGMALFIGCLLLAGLPILVMSVALRGAFTMTVDDLALTITGALSPGRTRLYWADQTAVGLAWWRGNRMLAVRPAEPLRRAPRRGLIWDRESGLLLISGLDNWSAPRDEVIDAVRERAGLLWNDHLDALRHAN